METPGRDLPRPKKEKSPRPRCPGDPVLLERYEVSAIKALSPHAISALEKITGVDTMSFAQGGEDGRRASDFFEGARWVGATLRQIRNMKMPGPQSDPSRGPPPGET